MRRVLILAFVCALAVHGFARGRGSGRSSSSHSTSHQSEHVGGYTTRSGRHVSSYRRAPAGMGTHHRSSFTRSTHTSSRHTAVASSGTHRDSHSRIKRSESAKHQFESQTGYPHGRPGYVVDHKTALACGGADAPSNMQWQTVAEAKAKDKWERKGCGR